MNERLGEILKETEANPERREELSEEWQKRFTEDDATVDELRSYLENQLEHGEHDANAFNVLLGNLTYIENNGHRMRYVSLREAGLPVGSGPTEGACKSLVSSRAKRSGQRWHDDGISAVLTLRAIHQSDRLPPFWKHLHRRYVAHVQPLDMAA